MSDALDTETIKALVGHYTCAKNCFGHRNNAGGCCKISDRDYIIGPMRDTEDFVRRLNEVLKSNYTVDDIFINFKEGSKLFPQKKAWQNPEHYPAMRLKMDDPSLPCQFLTDKSECGVYEIRPTTCQKYRCEHLKKVMDLL